MSELLTHKVWEFECTLRTKIMGSEVAYYAELEGEPIHLPYKVFRFHLLAEDEYTAIILAFTKLGNTLYKDWSVKQVP